MPTEHVPRKGILMAVAGFIGIGSFFGVIGQVDPFRGSYSLGDIVEFKTDSAVPYAKDQAVTAIMALAPGESGRPAACVLDMRLLHRAGGSLFIFAISPNYDYSFWWRSDGPTSAESDCGRAGDLRLPERDFVKLFASADLHNGALIRHEP